jgi:hypothetical protein
MASIISETFASGADKALQLGNEEWGRVMSIGADWTWLRLGFMYNFTPDGTNNIATADLRFGFSNAANRHVGSPSAGLLWYGAHFGAASNTSIAGGTWTYNAGSGNPYFSSSGNGRISYVNTGFAGGANSAGSYHHFTNGGSTLRRSVAFVDLEKNGTSLWVMPRAMSSLNNVDHTLAQFRAAMATAGSLPSSGNSSLTVGGSTIGGAGSTSFANYPTNAGTYGELVAPHIGWNKGLINFLNIFAIEVYRHA